MRHHLALVVITGLWAALAAHVSAQQANHQADKDVIAKKAEAFIETFHKGDADALAAFWTADGDYTTRKGITIKGRDAITKAFKEFFVENQGLKLRINSESLRFLTPDVAVEDGTTEVLAPDGTPPSAARYTIVHVKKDGDWLLGSVRDAPYVPPTNYEHLRALEWTIGDWASETNKGESARASFTWGKNQNFIVATIEATIKEVPVSGATQWIGWDPAAKAIRSWTFDDDGGIGRGAWTHQDNKWTIKSTNTLRDGKKLAATNIVTRIDADMITWQSVNRTLDGNALPDTPEIRMKRVKS
jgi:uncharacterized protein (TIGR02246 family)